MSPPHDPTGAATDPLAGTLLMTTWSDGEAEMVRRLLEAYAIPCQVVSDVPHSILPINVNGLGEVRILVARCHLETARRILAEHRRQGLELVQGGREDSETVPGGAAGATDAELADR